MNEIGCIFLCKKSPVHLPTWQTILSDFVKGQHETKYEVNKMRSHRLNMSRNAQVTTKSKADPQYGHARNYLLLS